MAGTEGSGREQARALEGDSRAIARGIFVRLKRMDPEKIQRRSGILYARLRKWVRRRRTRHPHVSNFPVFIAGSNRSGTQMVSRALGDSPHGWDYPETNRAAFDDLHLLRSDRLIARLIQWAPAPIVSFGSILDSQFAAELLDRFEGARVLWVYRRYQDAANSSATTWGGARDEVKGWMRWVARGEIHRLGAQKENVRPETQQLIARLYREELPTRDCACLYWYMRNRLYFDLGLDRDPRVLIVQYEDSVLNKERGFRRVFDFLGQPYHDEIVGNVSARSVGKDDWPGVDPAIEEVCDGLKAQLDAAFEAPVRPTLP